jgi:hypothetical protein
MTETYIGRIKAHRAKFRSDLKEAKDAVDAGWTEAGGWRDAEIAYLRAEVERLTERRRSDEGNTSLLATHAAGCESWGPGHYGCAMRELTATRTLLGEAGEVVKVFAQVGVKPECVDSQPVLDFMGDLEGPDRYPVCRLAVGNFRAAVALSAKITQALAENTAP